MRRHLLLFSFMLLAWISQAQYSIQGTILNEKGEAMTGASLQLKQTNIGTVSDDQGLYQLKKVKAGKYTLSVSFMGYQNLSQELEVQEDLTINFTLQPDNLMTEEVIVSALRLGENAPGTYSNLSKASIQEENMGQDIPYLIGMTPSVVTTSDAGTGIGYTGFRIRGSDANRINVTVNGIPINDAESHGVFWVNMPDFASSVDNIQIQRGVGTSTNGSGAFGGAINMQTNQLESEAYAEVSSAAGSFNTLKNTVKVGSGLLKNKFAFDARLSKITSDGFIDRAYSDLQSYYISGGYYGEKTLVKLNVFSGKEDTYQAWNGVPSVRLNNDLEGMQRYADHWLYTEEETEEMINSDSRTYNLYTYENEIDHYQQDHYQLFFSHKVNEAFSFNTALHYTYGRGYYEQYRKDDDLADYNISDIELDGSTISTSDLIRRKWLDNDFYGLVASAKYTNDKLDLTIGGAANQYDGRHFGNIIWGQYLGDIAYNYEWYRNLGTKTDQNIYTKANVELTKGLFAYADLQLRHITHDIEGMDDDYRDLTQSHSFTFFNPKAGVYYNPSPQHEAYFFYARGNREPNRSNFTDADPAGPVPTAEAMNDFELGYSFKNKWLHAGSNLYYMQYTDQLILTGEINDVGSAIMTNVDESYRMGVEFVMSIKPLDILSWDVNATFSQNKIAKFTEYVDNWDTWGQDVTELENTDIAFSPNTLVNSNINFKPINGLQITLQSQYVGKQFIDNTSNSERQLNAYFVNNLMVNYNIAQAWFDKLSLSFKVNNLFNSTYETNAWVYSYIYEGERWAMDGYYPQAGINFMTGLTIRF